MGILYTLLSSGATSDHSQTSPDFVLPGGLTILVYVL